MFCKLLFRESLIYPMCEPFHSLSCWDAALAWGFFFWIGSLSSVTESFTTSVSFRLNTVLKGLPGLKRALILHYISQDAAENLLQQHQYFLWLCSCCSQGECRCETNELHHFHPTGGGTPHSWAQSALRDMMNSTFWIERRTSSSGAGIKQRLVFSLLFWIWG